MVAQLSPDPRDEDMNKRTITGLFLFVVLAAGLAYFGKARLDRLAIHAVELVASDITGTTVRLKRPRISMVGGNPARLQMTVPMGFATDSNFRFAAAGLKFDLASFLATPVVIESMVIETPEFDVVLEQTAGAVPEEKTPSDPQVLIEELTLRQGTVSFAAPELLQDKMLVPLPEIHLTGIGHGGRRATPAEVVNQGLDQTLDALGDQLRQLFQQ